MQNKVTPTKFLFEHDFTKPGMITPEAKKAKITIQEHEAAIAQNYQKGYQKGVDDTRAEIENTLAAALSRLAAAAEQLITKEKNRDEVARSIATKVASHIAQKIAFHRISEEPLQDILSMVEQAYADLASSATLTIKINQEIVDIANEKVSLQLKNRGFEGQFIILEDSQIPIGDGAIEWSDGGMIVSQEDITKKCEEAIELWLSANRG
jgi:flagellar biosynthesis/type III secretory pathway protein FliH